ERDRFRSGTAHRAGAGAHGKKSGYAGRRYGQRNRVAAVHQAAGPHLSGVPEPESASGSGSGPGAEAGSTAGSAAAGATATAAVGGQRGFRLRSADDHSAQGSYVHGKRSLERRAERVFGSGTD